MWHFRKFIGTLRMASTVIMARTFGTYIHTVGGCTGDGHFRYAIYEYRGRKWIVPSEPMEPLE